MAGDLDGAVLGCRWRNKKDKAQAPLGGEAAQLRAFVHGQVRDDQAAKAGAVSLLQKRATPPAVDEAVRDHADEGHLSTGERRRGGELMRPGEKVGDLKLVV